MITLRFEEGNVDDAALSHFQRELWVLPTFMRYFLEYVTKELPVIIEIVKSEYAETRKNMKDQLSLPRFVDAYCVFCAISMIFMKYLTGTNNMDFANARKLVCHDRELIFEIIRNNDSELQTVSPAVMILQALKEAIDKGLIKLKHTVEIKESDDLSNLMLEDENFFYGISEDLWHYAKSYANFRKIFFPYTSGREIITPLKEEGILQIKQEGKNQRSSHKLSIQGKTLNRRYLYLRKEKVLKIWEKLEIY